MSILEQHPAPWRVVGVRGSVVDGRHEDAPGMTVITLAHTVFTMPQHIDEGAKRLILAAPELLEALNNLLNSICLDDFEPPSEEMENARELIARIDGDSCP